MNLVGSGLSELERTLRISVPIGWLQLVGRPMMFGLAVLSLCGCSPSGDQVTSSNVGVSSDLSVDSFQNRPLHLPSVLPNSFCPVSPEVNLPTHGIRISGMPVPDYGFGREPVYLSGQLTWYPGVVSMLLVSPTYTGPALARGRRLDQTGGFPFASPNGRLVLPRAKEKAWRLLGSSLYQRVAPGCYGLQIDGADFSTVIVFQIQPGPAPGG